MPDLPTAAPAAARWCAPAATARTLEFAPGDIQSEMLLSRPHALVLAYTRAMMCFALFVPRPRHIVMVGPGRRLAGQVLPPPFPARPHHRARTARRRDRPARPVPGAARRRPLPRGARRRRRLAGAPRRGQPADVLLVDGFDAAGLPPALASPPFYARLPARCCADGGVLVANVFSYDPRYARRAGRAGRARSTAAPAGSTRWPATTASCSRSRAAPDDGPPGRALALQRWLARRDGLGWIC